MSKRLGENIHALNCAHIAQISYYAMIVINVLIVVDLSCLQWMGAAETDSIVCRRPSFCFPYAGLAAVSGKHQ